VKDCDFIAAHGPHKEALLLEWGIHPEKMLRIGITRSDELIKNRGKVINQDLVYKITGLKGKKIISYLPTWWGSVISVEDIGKEIIRKINDDYILIFRPHPDTPDELIKEYEKLIEHKQNIIYLPENRFRNISLVDILLMSNMFIVDCSSVLTDAILTDKPIMFALSEKCPVIIEEVYEPMKEIFEYSIKLTMDKVDRINENIKASLNKKCNPDAWNIVKKRICYGLEGNSTEKLVEFIRDFGL
jgi:CDP-glycerol glycerophosphotransferase (TagB/SpsB family)